MNLALSEMTQEVKVLVIQAWQPESVPNPGTSLPAEGENQVHMCFPDLHLPAVALMSTFTHSSKALKDLGHKTEMCFTCLYVKCLLF